MINKLSDILIVCDVDGSLCPESADFVPARNVEAIGRFKEKGGLFSLATGRSPMLSRRYIDMIGGVSAPCINFNGGAVYDFNKEKFLYQKLLPENYRALLNPIIEAFPALGVICWVGHGAYISPHNDTCKIPYYQDDDRYSFGEMDELPGIPFKILFDCRHVDISALAEFVKDPFFAPADFVSSSTILFEMLPKNTTKGGTLFKLAELLHLPMENTVAIGDYDNDADLLQNAGLGVFVEGGSEKARLAADVTACPCEEGAVAEVIELLEEKYG